MTGKTFSDLGLSEALLRALRERAYTTPTPIQAGAIPALLEGRDLVGVAQTGTGKTAAFALPLLHALAARRGKRTPAAPRALVLTPTRELAAQAAAFLEAYGRHVELRHAAVYGGVSQTPQVRRLRRGVDILVATPGRLLDLIGQGHVDLGQVQVFVLDEGDRMLDMGFIPDVRRIIAELPRSRQSVLFSATMPASVVRLTETIVRDPVRVELTPPTRTADRIEQRLFLVESSDKRALLSEILKSTAMERTLVFTRTKHGANRLVKHLQRGRFDAEAIHGNKSQGARERALARFRQRRTSVLVATDVAARGIDVEGITHVVNFDLPNVPETYVHRIGRTARAGCAGVALSFCDQGERGLLRDIERLIRSDVTVVAEHPYKSSLPWTRRPRPASPSPGNGRRRGSRQRRMPAAARTRGGRRGW